MSECVCFFASNINKSIIAGWELGLLVREISRMPVAPCSRITADL